LPKVAEINNISLYLYPDDHNPPHIHCYKGEQSAVIDLRTGIVIVGDMKSSDLKEVKKWVTDNREELISRWKK
jgi:hypothetical protein